MGTLAIKEKRTEMKTATKCNRKNPTNTKALKLKRKKNELANIYPEEQIEYMQNQIDKIRDSVEDRQSRIAWQIVTKWAERRALRKLN